MVNDSSASFYDYMDFTDAFHLSSQILVLRSLRSSPAFIMWQRPGHSHSSTSQCSPSCYRASSSLHARSNRHAQDMFLQFCHYYGLLPVSADQDILLCFSTFLAYAKDLQHGTIFGYLYGVRALHIDMGLLVLLKGAFHLYKDPLAIHIQSNSVSHKLAFIYELLVLEQPIHKFPTH